MSLKFGARFSTNALLPSFGALVLNKLENSALSSIDPYLKGISSAYLTAYLAIIRL